MSLPNNPLRQYFRRPAIYLKLPSGGKGYSPDVIDMPDTGELPVYPMTAIDEITGRTPDALFNGNAITELIKSCIPNIKDPWRINSIDIDAILIAIRSAAQGSDFDVESTCPKCEETATYAVNLVSALSNITPGNYDKELIVGDLTIKFRPLIYKEINQAGMSQFEVQRVFATLDQLSEDERAIKTQEAVKTITDITMSILSQTIEYIKTPASLVSEKEFFLDFLQNCDKTTYIQIRDYHSTLKEQSAMKPMKIKCIGCSHEYEQSIVINASDFFG